MANKPSGNRPFQFASASDITGDRKSTGSSFGLGISDFSVSAVSFSSQPFSQSSSDGTVTSACFVWFAVKNSSALAGFEFFTINPWRCPALLSFGLGLACARSLGSASLRFHRIRFAASQATQISPWDQRPAMPRLTTRHTERAIISSCQRPPIRLAAASEVREFMNCV